MHRSFAICCGCLLAFSLRKMAPCFCWLCRLATIRLVILEGDAKRCNPLEDRLLHFCTKVFAIRPTLEILAIKTNDRLLEVQGIVRSHSGSHKKFHRRSSLYWR